jgi:hypothetical protein
MGQNQLQVRLMALLPGVDSVGAMPQPRRLWFRVLMSSLNYFILPNVSIRSMALEFTQTLTEMSIGRYL